MPMSLLSLPPLAADSFHGLRVSALREATAAGHVGRVHQLAQDRLRQQMAHSLSVSAKPGPVSPHTRVWALVEDGLF